MKRTISAMVGKGSVTHNSRSFTAENVDSERTHLNIDYCNEPIKKVYHELFDEALKQYNDKQKRKDRKIPDYYKHIESGKQEKLYHKIIFQIGNKDDMSATGEYAELDREIEEKQIEVKGLKATAEKIKEAKDSLDSIEHQLDNNPELQLPEPQGLMSAKSYKKKFVDPLIRRLKNLVRSAVGKSYLGWENYHRINNLNGRLYSENKHLKSENSRLREVNSMLREQNKAYRLLEKVFGKRKLNEIIEQARGFKKSKQRDAR